jgi:ABC-2 type transport system permease protein
VSDALTLAGRSVRLSLRQVDAVVTALVLPVMLMLMFVELFGGAIQTGTEYVRYVVPGVLLLCVGFSSATTAVSVCADMTGGIVDRLRSMDVGGAAVLAGHVAASLVRNAASTLLVVAVAFALGFDADASALDWLAALGVLAAYALAISWLAAALGLVAGSPESASGFMFLVMFLPYASSAFVPVETMPAGLQGFAAHQPITPLADALRALLLGTPVGSSAWIGMAWCAAIVAASVAVAGVLFARRA